LPPQPENVHVARYIPHSLLLPRCDLVVSHGGAGTMLAALSHGLPMLLVPRTADQFDNSDLCASLGVAERLLPAQLTPANVRTAARKLLGNPSYAQAARTMREQIDALPPPAAAVEQFEVLVASHATEAAAALHLAER
jgi:UDP:flavonoid glycosyltransferase YjiC (YdhE family)